MAHQDTDAMIKNRAAEDESSNMFTGSPINRQFETGDILAITTPSIECTVSVADVIRDYDATPEWTTLCVAPNDEVAYRLSGPKTEYMLIIPVALGYSTPPRLTSPKLSPGSEQIVEFEHLSQTCILSTHTASDMFEQIE